MRMRRKPNREPRMESCAAVQIKKPEDYRGRWRASFGEPLWLEIGCGKGGFTAALAREHPEVSLLAVEKAEDALVIAMERVCAQGINNVRFISGDALGLGDVLDSGETERIFLNFCDPWPKSRDAKHRLTSPLFLRIYAELLPEGGELLFRTDNLPLFEWSLGQLKAEGWDVRDVSFDLPEQSVMSDYETKFRAQGIKINALRAIKREETKRLGRDGEPQRLRAAALSDARGR